MNSHLESSNHLWNKKVPAIYFLMLIIVFGLLFAFTQFGLFNFHHQNTSSPVIVQSADCPPDPVKRYRMNDFSFTHPLLLTDILEEATDLAGLKNEIGLMIQQRKDAGQLTSASVYIRSLNNAKWISINPDEGFNPGSLIKVPIMMTYLREAEKNPGLLDKKLTLDASVKVPPQTYTGDRITPGSQYTIKQLIYYMIAKSDNYATYLLNNNVNISEFQKLFTAIGMPQPDVHSRDFRITASEYSKFFRMLYNAAYINDVDAEYALKLLTESDFKDGMLKLLPPEIKVAHKFGEWGDAKDRDNHQLHETGIIFYNNSPMLFTIMTKGPDVKMLPQIISEISKRAFDKLAEAKPAT